MAATSCYTSVHPTGKQPVLLAGSLLLLRQFTVVGGGEASRRCTSPVMVLRSRPSTCPIPDEELVCMEEGNVAANSGPCTHHSLNVGAGVGTPGRG